jgi:hypothetical protein
MGGTASAIRTNSNPPWNESGEDWITSMSNLWSGKPWRDCWPLSTGGVPQKWGAMTPEAISPITFRRSLARSVVVPPALLGSLALVFLGQIV